MFILNTALRSIALPTLLATLSMAVTPLRAGTPADDKEMRDYRLTMEKVQKYVTAATAIQADSKASQCMKENELGKAPSLDAFEKKFNNCPSAVAIVKGAGLAPRELMVISAVLLSGMMLVGMKKAGQIQKYPPSISPENAAFLEKNADKIGPMIQPLMKSDK